MKKIWITFGVIFLCISAFIYYNKLYSPIENMSKKDTLHKVKRADDLMVALIIKNDHQWNITVEHDISKVN